MTSSAPVAQLDRASGYEPEGRVFESRRAHQKRFFSVQSQAMFLPRRQFLKTTLASTALSGLAQAAAPKRIAFGGIAIECSTYSRIRAKDEDFTILRGPQLGQNDRFSFLKSYPSPFLPTIVATAVPDGPVAADTYKRIKAEFLQRIQELLPLDGLYLPMHGAMFVDGMYDAEGDWYSAVRKLVGPKCLLSASYDLHGNISKRVIDNLDMLSAFRTAPHIDREETMRRACDMLLYCLDHEVQPTLVWAPIPVLMPGERTSTEWDPGKRLWAQLPALNAQPGVLDVSLLVGYVWADELRSTASAVLTGTVPATLKKTALSLAQQYWDARNDFQFGTKTGTIAECVRWAIAAPTQPAILADSGDNPTGGGTGDRAEVLEELLRQQARNVVFAGICDRLATEGCYRAGVGATLSLSIGATLDPLGSKPVKTTAKVIFLSHTDENLERQAVVEVAGIKVVLTARRRPFHDIIDFTSLNLQPKDFKVIVVKSGYLSPELKPLANPSLMALSDGAINQDLEHLPHNRLRKPSYPFVPDLQFTPFTVSSARSPK
jgi:microcystin degradation protein MlrC